MVDTTYQLDHVTSISNLVAYIRGELLRVEPSANVSLPVAKYYDSLTVGLVSIEACLHQEGTTQVKNFLSCALDDVNQIQKDLTSDKNSEFSQERGKIVQFIQDELNRIIKYIN